MRITVFECATQTFGDEAERAKASGRAFADMALPHAPRGAFVDPDADLCRVQMEQAARGFVSAEIGSNVYGFCLRDTLNDGLGRISPNFKDLGEAIEFARVWHAAKPDLRQVSICLPYNLADSLTYHNALKAAGVIAADAVRPACEEELIGATRSAIAQAEANGHRIPYHSGGREAHIYATASCESCRARLSVSRNNEIEGSAYEDRCLGRRRSA